MQGASQKQGGKGSAKKRKSPEASAEGVVLEGKQDGNAVPAAMQGGEAGDAEVKLPADGSPKQSSPGGKGLASLLGNKGVIR